MFQKSAIFIPDRAHIIGGSDYLPVKKSLQSLTHLSRLTPFPHRYEIPQIMGTISPDPESERSVKHSLQIVQEGSRFPVSRIFK